MSKAGKATRTTPAANSLPVHKKQGEVIPVVGFTKLEKNLASLGFFTASSKTVRRAQEKKITFSKRAAGSNKTVEASATILPSHKYGLPITSDQDKYLALLKIVADVRREKGEVQNPIGFTSAEILRLLNKRISAGKNYDDIEDWLNRMTLTGIKLDMFTLMFGCIAIGLAVDDTIHLIAGFRRYLDQTGDPIRSVDLTLRTTGRALLVTSVVLTAGFLVFQLSSMSNLRDFGLITAFAIAMAFVLDVLATPALLVLVTRGRGQKA